MSRGRPPVHSDEQLLYLLREALTVKGEGLTAKNYSIYRREHPDLSLPDESTIRQRLGSWKNAVAAALLFDQLALTTRRVKEPLPLTSADPKALMQEQMRQMQREVRGIYPQLVKGLPAVHREMLSTYLHFQQEIARRTGAIETYRTLKKEQERLLTTCQRQITVSHRTQQFAKGEVLSSRERREAQQRHRQELLTALRDRDSLQRRVTQLEIQLAQVQESRTDTALASELVQAQNRERWVLLSHFRRRLEAPDRFGLRLSMREAFELDEYLQNVPVFGYTRRGTPVKMTVVDAQEIYVVMTPDKEGRMTATTVYTKTMWTQNNQWAF